MPRLPPPHCRAYTNRKAMAKKMKYRWRLNQDEFYEVARQPCTDCAKAPCMGVYRIDTSPLAPFSADNVVPLCADCGRKRPKRGKRLPPAEQQQQQVQPIAQAIIIVAPTSDYLQQLLATLPPSSVVFYPPSEVPPPQKEQVETPLTECDFGESRDLISDDELEYLRQLLENETAN